MRRAAGLAALLLGLLVPPAAAQQLPLLDVVAGAACAGEPAPARWSWQGASDARRVRFASRATGLPVLCGTLVTPPAGAFAGPRPGVVLLPPTGGGPDALMWLARDLAGHGTVVLIAVPAPQGTDGSVERFVDAARSGLDLLADQPGVDAGRLAAGGFSQGAIAASVAQDRDPRVRALVAVDNLASTAAGDAGSPRCPGSPSAAPVVPRVPALGIASDEPCSYGTAETRKTAFERWRAAGLPAMQVVLRGTGHLELGQDAAEAVARPAAHLARAWLDLHLAAAPDGVARLTGATPDGRPRAVVLSSVHHSALHLPQAGLDCPAFERGCP